MPQSPTNIQVRSRPPSLYEDSFLHHLGDDDFNMQSFSNGHYSLTLDEDDYTIPPLDPLLDAASSPYKFNGVLFGGEINEPASVIDTSLFTQSHFPLTGDTASDTDDMVSNVPSAFSTH